MAMTRSLISLRLIPQLMGYYYCFDIFTVISIPSRSDSNRAALCRIKRKVYSRMYPVTLALANGASIQIRHHEPRALLQRLVISYLSVGLLHRSNSRPLSYTE
ncbi:hypothetical protein FGIG_12050 [Fasciola gigantica]|uniref:39S ribosomal protein L55 mitochondrial n=1 Tax=Fasciola gigantica TaxID=46835 RepID=A0A504YYR3_FASGI|nr:hypothetical protein FGIG_12050 [Fasciola gigantica]